MNKRDLAIVSDIERFRVLSRDQIIELHFSGVKQPVSSCNIVLKRLQDRGYIKAYKDFQPYVYASKDSKFKNNSQKTLHFLKITDTYLEFKKYSKCSDLMIEPKLGDKGTVEPDMFLIFKRTPFFVEIQRSVYTEKTMKEKIQRYEQYYYSQTWKKLEWQKENKEVFPIIIICTDTRYNIQSQLKVLQVSDIKTLVSTYETTNNNAINNNMANNKPLNNNMANNKPLNNNTINQKVYNEGGIKIKIN
jgi:hypothetical protein